MNYLLHWYERKIHNVRSRFNFTSPQCKADYKTCPLWAAFDKREGDFRDTGVCACEIERVRESEAGQTYMIFIPVTHTYAEFQMELVHTQ